jgi:choice-of-anchor A domain-containing protein
MFLSKLKALGLATLLFGSYQASAQNMPKSYKDFQVYAIEGIYYSFSDFQGIVGSGGPISLQNFSILDDRSQLGGFKNPFPYSVFAKDFFLSSGTVQQGGVYAQDSITLINASVAGNISTKKAYVKNASVRGRTSKVPTLHFVNFQYDLYKFANNMGNTDGKLPTYERLTFGERDLGHYQVFRAAEGDGKLMNVFSVSNMRNFAISSNGDSREYFVIVNRDEHVDLSYLDIKLLDGVSPTKILYVFPYATTIKINNSGVSSLSGREVGLGIPGSIVAPHADIYFTDGLVTGSIYAKTLRGSPESTGTYQPGGQVNYAPFVCFASNSCRDLSDIDYE